MISAQAGCRIHDALALLRARAYADGLTIDEVADQVIARTRPFDWS
ncbi:hypothetical protein [Tsukamurella soli]